MVSGIYTITNKVNGKLYVGLSNNVHHRFSQHKSDLNHNRHSNPYLQNAWNKYGADAFEFKLLKCCKPRYLARFERVNIRKFRSSYRENGYNLDEGGTGIHTRSEETLKKLREQKLGEKNPQYGIPHTLEHNAKISKNMSSTGIFRVSKKKDKCCTQGFLWVYRWHEDGKQQTLRSVDLNKLKEKVLNNGLEWREF